MKEVKAQILKLAGNLLTQDVIQEFHLYQNPQTLESGIVSYSQLPWDLPLSDD